MNGGYAAGAGPALAGALLLIMPIFSRVGALPVLALPVNLAIWPDGIPQGDLGQGKVAGLPPQLPAKHKKARA